LLEIFRVPKKKIFHFFMQCSRSQLAFFMLGWALFRRGCHNCVFQTVLLGMMNVQLVTGPLKTILGALQGGGSSGCGAVVACSSTSCWLPSPHSVVAMSLRAAGLSCTYVDATRTERHPPAVCSWMTDPPYAASAVAPEGRQLWPRKPALFLPGKR